MDGLATSSQILSSKFDRIAAEPFSQFVDLRFSRKRDLCRAESAEGTGRDGVGVNRVAVHLDVRNPVRSYNAVGRPPRDQWTILRVSAGVEVDDCLKGEQPPFAIHSGADADTRIIIPRGEHGLL